jgi:hypothetical protein
MKDTKWRAKIWLLATTTLLPALAGCELHSSLVSEPSPSIAPDAVASFLQDFAHQTLAVLLF